MNIPTCRALIFTSFSMEWCLLRWPRDGPSIRVFPALPVSVRAKPDFSRINVLSFRLFAKTVMGAALIPVKLVPEFP